MIDMDPKRIISRELLCLLTTSPTPIYMICADLGIPTGEEAFQEHCNALLKLGVPVVVDLAKSNGHLSASVWLKWDTNEKTAKAQRKLVHRIAGEYWRTVAGPHAKKIAHAWLLNA